MRLLRLLRLLELLRLLRLLLLLLLTTRRPSWSLLVAGLILISPSRRRCLPTGCSAKTSDGDTSSPGASSSSPSSRRRDRSSTASHFGFLVGLATVVSQRLQETRGIVVLGGRWTLRGGFKPGTIIN